MLWPLSIGIQDRLPVQGRLIRRREPKHHQRLLATLVHRLGGGAPTPGGGHPVVNGWVMRPEGVARIRWKPPALPHLRNRAARDLYEGARSAPPAASGLDRQRSLGAGEFGGRIRLRDRPARRREPRLSDQLRRQPPRHASRVAGTPNRSPERPAPERPFAESERIDAALRGAAAYGEARPGGVNLPGPFRRQGLGPLRCESRT